VFYKIGLEIWGTPSPQNWWSILARFRTSSQLDCKYLRTGTRYQQWENGITICEHSPTCLLNLVYVGPQTAKNSTVYRSNPESRF